MNLFRLLPLRLRSLFRKRSLERELHEEMSFHLEAKVEELRSRGMPEQDAQRLALREFGSIALHQDQCRDQRKWNWLEAILRDVRYSARALLRSPGFSAVAICSLALGIGSTAAIFAVFDVAVLHPLAARHADRLVWFREYGKDRRESGGNPARFLDWQRARSFEAAAGAYSEGLILTGDSSRVRLEALRYVGQLPQTLEAHVQIGRLPGESEVREGTPVLVLTDAAWRKSFHADPAVLSHPLRLSGKLYQVIGVFNPDVRYPETMDFWSPAPRELQGTTREAGFLAQIARLSPGVSLTQAQAEIDTLAAQAARDHPATDAGRSLRLQFLTDHLSEGSRTPLLFFLAAALGVLLIACVNMAGLLLARGLNRQRETSVRAALGAARFRLVRLFLTEALLLSFAGCACGIGLAVLGMEALKIALPEDTPRLAEAAVTVRVLLFAAALATASALLSGFVPAWKAASRATACGLKEGSQGSRGGVHTRLRSTLVVAQIAGSLLLLISSGLLINSFVHMREKPLGFNPQRAYSFTVAYPWDSPGRVVNTAVSEVLAKLSAVPGVQSAGVVDRLPLHGGSQSRAIVMEGISLSPDLAERQIGWRMASGSFFSAAGIPLLSGRLYQPFRGAGPRECLISKQLAVALFASQEPIGKRIASRPRKGQSAEWFQITGVLGDTRINPLDAAGALEVYVPWGADYWPVLNFVVRTDRSMGDVAQMVRSDVEPILSAQIIENLATLDDLTANTRSAPRTRAILAATLAGVALLLSAVGLFALMAHETVRRTQEYGVRLALGAQPGTLAWDAIRRALRLTIPGIALGLGAAILLSRTLQSFLYEVRATDPATYVIASILLFGVAIAASLLPAVRAARINPVTALRHE